MKSMHYFAIIFKSIIVCLICITNLYFDAITFFFDLGYSKYKLSMGLHKINNTNLFMTKPNVLNKIRYHSKKKVNLLHT